MSTFERVRPASVTDDALPPRWSVLLFRLPGASGRARTALWRLLNELGALKLGQGTWAIPHRDGRPPDLARAFARIHASGGEAWSREVGTTGDDDQRLQVRLLTACEQLWDGFFHDLDRARHLIDGDPVAADAQVTELRVTFSRLLVRDLLISPAARRAEHRLGELTATVQAHLSAPAATASPTDAGGPGADAEDPGPRRRHTIGATTVVELADARVRTVMQLTPPADAAWEQAFNEFEGFAYAPDVRRAQLRHNTFTVVTTADRVADEESAARERLARFESFLGR